MSRRLQAEKIMDSLKVLSKASQTSLNELRLIVALERAIARLERHPRLSGHLVYKGGFVLLKTFDSTRFTRDVDALAIGISRTSVVGMVEHSLKIDLYDGLWYGDIKFEDLKDQGPYGGYRFTCAFQVGEPPKEPEKIKKLSRIHIDIGFGDAIQSVPDKRAMRSILADSKPVSWSVYPLEYIFAEKLEALFSRGSANSRAKYIYDMPLIFPGCDLGILVNAITKTFEGRETPIPSSFKATASTFDLAILQRSWGSVDIPEGASTFDSSWKALMSNLEQLDAMTSATKIEKS